VTDEQTIPGTPSLAPARGAASLAAAGVLGGLAIALVLAMLSDGVYHDDDICHFLFARDALAGGTLDANALLHQWARPGYNLPAAVAAFLFGLTGCRILSAGQTAGVAALAFLIARRLTRRVGLSDRWAAAAPVLVWLQPLTMTLGITTLTETAAALYLALGVWLYLRGNRVWAMAAFSALFVTRYETLALAPLLAAFVLWDARAASGGKFLASLRRPWVWGCLAATAWAPAAYALAAWWADLPPEDSPLYMFARDYSGEYGSGAIWHFVSIWPEAAGMGGLALAAVGAIALRRRAALPAALCAGLVALHSLLFWRGSFATGGYARFLVPLAAPLAALAAAGLGELWRAKRRTAIAASLLLTAGWIALVIVCWAWVLPEAWRLPVKLASAAAVLPMLAGAMIVLSGAPRRALHVARAAAVVAACLVVAQGAVQIRPLHLESSPAHCVVGRALAELAHSEYRDRPGISQHVLIRYLREDTQALFSNHHALEQWRSAEPGTLFFWENKYCEKPHEPASTRELHESMRRLGRLIQTDEEKGVVIEIYERLPDRGT
jgi:hypothetical protein